MQVLYLILILVFLLGCEESTQNDNGLLNTKAKVNILSPVDNQSFFEGDSVHFSVEVTDLNGQIFKPKSISWTSNIDNMITNQYESKKVLSKGQHQLDLLVEFADGSTIELGKNIVVQDFKNKIRFKLSIEPGKSYRQYTPIDFTASVLDTNNNPIDVDSIEWISSIDGLFSTMQSQDYNRLSLGNHNIYVNKYFDNPNRVFSDTIAIEIIKNTYMKKVTQYANILDFGYDNQSGLYVTLTDHFDNRKSKLIVSDMYSDLDVFEISSDVHPKNTKNILFINSNSFYLLSANYGYVYRYAFNEKKFYNIKLNSQNQTNGNIFKYGSNGFIFKSNNLLALYNEMSLIWTIDIDYQINDVKKDFNNNIIVTGQKDSNILFQKIDYNGNVIQEKIYGGSNIDMGMKIFPMPNDEYIIVGNTTSFGRNDINSLLLMFDGNGKKIFETIFGEPNQTVPFDAIKVVDGIIVTTLINGNGGHLYKFDFNGNFIWKKYITTGGKSLYNFGNTFLLFETGYRQSYMYRLDFDGNY